jgi:hypothetical protein
MEAKHQPKPFTTAEFQEQKTCEIDKTGSELSQSVCLGNGHSWNSILKDQDPASPIIR